MEAADGDGVVEPAAAAAAAAIWWRSSEMFLMDFNSTGLRRNW